MSDEPLVIDFGGVDDASDYTPVPAATYFMQVVEAELKAAKNTGNQYINLALKIIKGDHNGRKVWDTCHLSSEKAQQRTKLVLSRLGIDVGGKVDLRNPGELLRSRCAIVTLEIEEIESDEVDGDGKKKKKKRNKVPYDGYEKTPADFEAPALADEGDFLAGIESGGAPLPVDDDLPFDA